MALHSFGNSVLHRVALWAVGWMRGERVRECVSDDDGRLVVVGGWWW